MVFVTKCVVENLGKHQRGNRILQYGKQRNEQMNIGKIRRIIRNVPKPIIVPNWPKPQKIENPIPVKLPEKGIIRF